MEHGFDKDYWEQHWQESPDAAPADDTPAQSNPYVARLARELPPGTALEAGCGTGAEALELAAAGWDVTGADISAAALAAAARHAALRSVSGNVGWVETDLVSWEPGRRFDLVTTNYAHPAMPQLAFYSRVAEWVAPGGTLLVVGHGRDAGTGTGHGHGHGHDADTTLGHRPPADATVTAEDIKALLPAAEWDIVTAEEQPRTLTAPDGRPVTLRDVVVQATRLP